MPVFTLSADPVYNVINLGTKIVNSDPNLYNSSYAESISANGQVAGYVLGETMLAALFDSTGGGNNIGLGEGIAYSINDSGQIVGYSDRTGGSYAATIFDSTGDGNNICLGALPGYGGSVAYSNNNNGQIVGASYNLSDYRATLFDSTGDGNNIDLGALPGYQYSIAYSINDNGQIVGASYNSASNYYRATLFDSTGDGNNIDLGEISGSDYNYAFSINNNGLIVGRSGTRAALFDPTGDGNNIDLGTLPGYGDNKGAASSINNKGQIAGCSTATYYADYRAVLFDPSGGGNNIDLNTLTDPNLGWHLNEASCINDNGWIVGNGTNPLNQDRAFLLKPDLVDAFDYANLANWWCQTQCGDCGGADENSDGDVDFDDLKILCDNWLTNN